MEAVDLMKHMIDTTIAGHTFPGMAFLNKVGESDNPKEIQLVNIKAKELKITNGHFSRIIIKGCQFDRLRIDTCVVRDNVQIMTPVSDAGIEEPPSIKRIQIKELTAIKLDAYDFDSISFTSANNISLVFIQIDREICSHISVEGKFDQCKLGIHGNPMADKPASISDFHLKSLSKISIFLEYSKPKNLAFSGVFSDVAFNLGEFTVKNLIFNHFRSEKSLKIKNLHIQKNDSLLQMLNSDFGNISFYECNFSANEFFLKGCTFKDCDFFETDWPEEPNIRTAVEKQEDNKEVEYKVIDIGKQKISYFRHLKNVYEKHGDILQSAKFRSKELVEIEKNCDSLLDKITLSIGYASSVHGTNWLAPAIWVLAINFVSTIIVMIVSDLCNPCKCSFWYNMSVMINPVHKLSDFSFLRANDQLDKLNGILVFFDLLIRVINSYLFFQTVRSFRKYIK